MKQLLTIILIAISISCFGQPKVDTVKVDENSLPLISVNDLVQVLQYLDDKLISKDHRVVSQAIEAVVQNARKRKITNK